MSNPDDVLAHIDAYYTQRLRAHGATPAGVDWNSSEAQTTRFDQLLRILPQHDATTIIDYGCGYGALFDYLQAHGSNVTDYQGYDISASMIERARELHGADRFVSDPALLRSSDFVIASGIFSVKMAIDTQRWRDYIVETLDSMWALARRGMAFNLLTAYSDRDRMIDRLHYADPHELFDLCRTRFSRNVALLHDYGLYEFTMLVRRA